MTIVKEYNHFNQLTCPECGGDLVSVIEKGETICFKCGLIISEREFNNKDSGIRAYNNEQKVKKEINGTPISPLLPDISLCTFISKKKIYNTDLKRAVKINNYLPWKKQNLLIAMTELKRLSHNLTLPDYIKKSAYKTYKEALDANIVKGRAIIGMVAACIYYTCKNRNIPRTFQEIIDETPLNAKKVRGFYSKLVETLNLKTPVNNPVAHIPHFIARLGLGFEVERLTVNIIDEYLKNNSLRGKNPNGLCAGAIYLAARFKNKRITQKSIADIVGVTDTTIRSRYKEIINKINLNILNR